MALDDIYYRQPWTPNQGLGSQIDRAAAAWDARAPAQAQLDAQRQANKDAAYSSPAREANPHEAGVGSYIQNLMESHPNFQPGFKERLTQEVTGGGLAKPAAPPSMEPAGLASPPMDSPRGDAGDMRSGLSAPPVPMSMNGEPMRRPLVHRDEAPPQAPQVQGPQMPMAQGRPQAPMTRGDVDLYMKMAPIFNTQKPQRDYMGEIAARGTLQKDLELLKQKGRVELKDITNGQRTLELAAKTVMDQKNLDEKTAYHVNQISLGYARITAVQNMLDRNLDFKKVNGGDEILKEAVKTIDSMTSSRAALIGSAFASTPEGQHALEIMDEVTSKTLPIIQQRMAADQGAPSQPGSVEVTGTSRFDQARIPNGAAPRQPTIVPAPQAAPRAAPRAAPAVPPGQTPDIPVRVRLLGDYKGMKKGLTGTISANEFDPNYMEKI